MEVSLKVTSYRRTTVPTFTTATLGLVPPSRAATPHRAPSPWASRGMEPMSYRRTTLPAFTTATLGLVPPSRQLRLTDHSACRHYVGWSQCHIVGECRYPLSPLRIQLDDSGLVSLPLQ